MTISLVTARTGIVVVTTHIVVDIVSTTILVCRGYNNKMFC